VHQFTRNRDELVRAAAKAFYGTSVDITRVAEAVLNSSPNVEFYVGTGAGVADLSTTCSVSMTAITGADVDNGPGANSQRGDLVHQRLCGSPSNKSPATGRRTTNWTTIPHPACSMGIFGRSRSSWRAPTGRPGTAKASSRCRTWAMRERCVRLRSPAG
jgi:hypothetical protein